MIKTRTNAKRVLARALSNNQGSIAPLFGLMAMPMFFVMGVSVDYSRSIAVQGNVQNALDAGALAAMQSSAADPEAVGTKIFNENFHESRVISKIVHFTKLDDGSVRATASVSMPTTVASLIGVNTLQVETFSVVEPSHEVTTTTESSYSVHNIPCIHVMDQSGSNTFYLQNNTDLDAKKCIAHVRSNKSNYAMREVGGNDVEFKRIRVKGSGTYSNGLKNGSDVVKNNSDVVGNPYSASVTDVIQAISIGSCTNANTNKTWTGTVNPGTYCGSTEFKDVTLNTGLYVIKSGNGNGKDGNLKFSGTVNGSAGVSFFLADGKSTFSSYNTNSGSVLKAPTTGTTRGLLFFEDSNRGNSWSTTLSTSHPNSWEGLVYLPSANVTLQGMVDWSKFEVSMASNQLIVKNWNDMEWKPYAWTPFNKTTAITLTGDDDTVTSSSSTTTSTSIYLKE